MILLHVSPTNVLFSTNWGSIDLSININTNSDEEAVSVVNNNDHSKSQLEDDFDDFTASRATDLTRHHGDSQIPYKIIKILIVKDHDMKEKVCSEVERLSLSAMIMGSRGFSAVRRGNDGRLGSFGNYCVHHWVCPVPVVCYPDDKDGGIGAGIDTSIAIVTVKEREEGEALIKPVLLEHEH